MTDLRAPPLVCWRLPWFGGYTLTSYGFLSWLLKFKKRINREQIVIRKHTNPRGSSMAVVRGPLRSDLSQRAIFRAWTRFVFVIG